MEEQQTEFAVEVSSRGGAAVVAVRGEVDPVTAPELEQALSSTATSGAASLIVDFSETTFLDSSGVHALLRAGSLADAAGTRLLVVCGTSCIRSVLEITGVDRRYELHATLGAATRAAEEPRPAETATRPRLLRSWRRPPASGPASL